MRSPSISIRKNKGKSTECCSKVGLKKGPWTAEEDKLLSDYVKMEGEGRWRTLPKRAGLLRCGKSCRLRWMNYLRPSVKRGGISADEEDLILRLHRLLGNRWSLIAGRIPGRTDNEIKNYWNTHLSKKLISQGIDPKTHKPIFNPAAATIIGSTKQCYSYPAEQLSVIQDPNSSHVPISTTILSSGIQFTGNLAAYCSGIKKDLGGDGNEEGTCSYNKELGYGGEDGIDCLVPDDAFSSFLNSLINDDMFNNNKQQEQDPQLNKTSTNTSNM